MTNQIAIIDPFVKSPAIHCFNRLINILGLKASYHMPSSFGIESLINEAPRTQGYIVLGSASHVHEKLSWHSPLSQFLLNELNNNKPVLGCCFGHQLICHSLGANVEYHLPDEGKKSGVREITVTENFWNFTKGETLKLAVTHKQVVKNLPPELKSVGHGLENDIVIHKTLPFMGTQAHPEASDYFCHHDIHNLTVAEIEAAKKDGELLIQRFFQHFKII
jgi:GMP synthase-like glutamine amidotransferase